jgi:ferredoxin
MTAIDEALVSAFGMPGFLLPWADRFFDPLELALIEALAAGPLPAKELLTCVSGLTPDDLARAHRRWVVDLEDRDAADLVGGEHAGAIVTLSDFHARFDVWAMFEGWKDVPADIAARLSDWELEHYVARIESDVTALRDGVDSPGGDAELSYLLLEEAEAVVRAAPRVYLRPCDCRAMFRRCRKPRDVCLGVDNERGLGWEISRERAVEILRAADRAGLMHTGYVGRTAGEVGGICNCCTDCCFPQLAAERLGVAAVWPRRRYRAAVTPGACTVCGLCVKRCPFGALSLGDELVVDPSLCRGCGLCATGCPEDALAMEPLADAVPQTGNGGAG